MSRPFMPWYIGDYLRDTAHLTTEQHGAYMLLLAHCWQHERIPIVPAERAAIAKLTPARWKSIAGPVERFFGEDGTQKRVTEEIDRTERKIAQRRDAGKNGGIRSGVARALKLGSEFKAKEQAGRKRERSERFVPDEAKSQRDTKQSPTNQNHLSISSTSSTAEGVVENVEETVSAGLLATARLGGALARPPAGEQAAKRPAEVSRAELDAMFEARRNPVTGH